MIKIKRAYLPDEKSDGYRVLVDRLWPRGVSKEKAKIDLWMKDIAPSTGLRKWFGHDPDRWGDFVDKYKEELKSKKDLVLELKDLEKNHKTICLIYAAKDEEHNEAKVLQEVLGNN